MENTAENRIDVQYNNEYNDDVDVEYNDDVDIDSSKEDSATAESKQISEEITGKYRGIEQKGMTFDQIFCYFLSLSSSLFFLEGKRIGEKNNQSCG